MSNRIFIIQFKSHFKIKKTYIDLIYKTDRITTAIINFWLIVFLAIIGAFLKKITAPKSRLFP